MSRIVPWAPRERSVLEPADRRHLGRERRPVLAPDDEPEPHHAGVRLGQALPRGARELDRLLGHDEAEVLADELGGRVAEQGLGRVGEEREPALGVVAPDHVRRRLDEAAVVGLGRLDPFEQVRVGQGDRGMVGEGLEGREAIGRDRARLAVADRQRADDLATGGAQRRRGHRTQAHAVGHVDVVVIARDARVGDVARRPHDAALARREAVDAAVDREPLAAQPVA